MLIKIVTEKDRTVVYTPRYRIRFHGVDSTVRPYEGQYVDMDFFDAAGQKISARTLSSRECGRITFSPIKPRTWFGRLWQRVRTYFERMELREWEWFEEKKGK